VLFGEQMTTRQLLREIKLYLDAIDVDLIEEDHLNRHSEELTLVRAYAYWLFTEQYQNLPRDKQ
jgi:hypothetical protein